MFLGHKRLEIGGGDVVGAALSKLPFHEETVGQTSVDTEDEHGLWVLYARAIVIVGDVKTLMEAAFDAPRETVEFEPMGGTEPLTGSAGDESDLFVDAALSLTQQAGGLCGKGKAHVLSVDLSGANGSILPASLVDFASSSLCWGGLIEGGNPLVER